MKEFTRGRLGAFFDLRVFVGLCGIALSVAAHELFHIVLHFGEIDSIHIFPDNQAIVEVIFTPLREYNLIIEEAMAYTITMVTLLLTAMLVADIHDVRSEKSATQTILAKDFGFDYSELDEQKALQHLAHILEIPS